MPQARGGTNYYDILEVRPDAPQNEIHRAYQRAKATYSQDNPALYSMFSKDEARALSQMIEEAYSILGNSISRKNYDDSFQGELKKNAAPAQRPEAKVPTRDQEVIVTPSAEPEDLLNSQLPDFAPPTEKIEKSVPTKNETSYNTTTRAPMIAPHSTGPGKTVFGTYKVDDSIEVEIQGTQECDGRFLQRVRVYKNIGLEQISEITKIGRHHLVAIESNDYSKLPAPVFARGYVVQISKILGLDPERVAASYMRLMRTATGSK